MLRRCRNILDCQAATRLWVQESWLPWFTIALTVCTFAGAILLVSHYLRGKIRNQMISRDGTMLHSMVLAQQYELDPQDPLPQSFRDPATQYEIVLKTSRLLRDVIAARLFDSRGETISVFPEHVTRNRLPLALVEALRRLTPVNRFEPEGSWRGIFAVGAPPAESASAAMPLLEINVPLHEIDGAQLLGIAQFVVGGESVAAQFRALDSYLIRFAGVIFVTGATLIALALGRAFRQLQQSNRLLKQRTGELQRTNQELVLASKTSAVGTVVAHLIHGLRTPLFGLKNLANECVQNSSGNPDASWEVAAATAEQMHDLIDTVVRVLQDEQSLVDCQVAFADLAELLQNKCRPTAASLNVHFSAQCQAQVLLPYRAANLVLLILQNLVENALQATPAGKDVRLQIRQCGSTILCEVRDQGPGVPFDYQKLLFAPCRSTKPHSSGIGLAISKQLANHLGAKLELRTSTMEGSVFALVLPEEVISANDRAFAA